MNFFSKLFAKKPAETAEVPPEFLQENPPEWVIILNGRQLPDGGGFSIRAPLFQSSRSGVAEITDLPATPGGEVRTISVDFTRPEIDRLFIILGFSFPKEFATVAGPADSGVPVTLTIYRESPFNLCTADCNLADWIESRKSGPPVVEIGRILIEARRRTLPP
jgi:hypothetical protein